MQNRQQKTVETKVLLVIKSERGGRNSLMTNKKREDLVLEISIAYIILYER